MDNNNDWSWEDAQGENLRDTVMINMTDVTIADDGDEVGVITAQRLINELDAAYATAIECLADALNDDIISWETYSEIFKTISDIRDYSRAKLMRIISRD